MRRWTGASRWGVPAGLLAAALAALGCVQPSSGLYTVVKDLGADSERLAAVAPATAALGFVGTGIADCCFLPSGVSALDPAGDLFYFVARYDAETDLRLFGVSTASGTVASQPVLAAGYNYNFLGFDPTPAPGTVLAVVKDLGADSERLATIDPATGALTPVGAGIAACCFIPSGVSAVDPDADVFYFVGRTNADPGTTSKIFAFDTATGSLVTDPAPTLPAGYNYNFLGFDPSPAPGTLYTVAFEHATSSEKLATIDPVTGALGVLGSGVAGCCGVSSGVSAVDPDGDVFYFIGALTGASERRIFALDIATGDLVHSPAPVLPSGFNYNFLEFDPTPGGDSDSDTDTDTDEDDRDEERGRDREEGEQGDRQLDEAKSERPRLPA